MSLHDQPTTATVELRLARPARPCIRTKGRDFARLPAELQEEILAYLDTSSVHVLSNLCLVNKSFNARFSRKLYYHFDLIKPIKFGEQNGLNSALLATLASSRKYVRSVSIVQELPNGTWEPDPGSLAMICAMLPRNQLREIEVKVDGIRLIADDKIDNREPVEAARAAANILLHQTSLEKIRWSMLRNLPTGVVRRGVRVWDHYTMIARMPRPALTSLDVLNFHSYNEGALWGIKAFLFSAKNLSEFEFGLSSIKDEFISNSVDRRGFDGDIYCSGAGVENPEVGPIPPLDGDATSDSEEDLDAEDEYSRNKFVSASFLLFRFISRKCDFNGKLTALKLEKMRFDGHPHSHKLVAESFKMDALRKLVLLDCYDLPSFLDALRPAGMKLRALHLEYRCFYADRVAEFVDTLPPDTLRDLALMQWGGSSLGHGYDVAHCLRIHGPYLRSLVLDHRENATLFDPRLKDRGAGGMQEWDHRSVGSPVPLPTYEDLVKLFSSMVNLEELGLSCYPPQPTSRNRDSPILAPYTTILPRQYPEFEPFDYKFLQWLADANLPRLRTFQMRNTHSARHYMSWVDEERARWPRSHAIHNAFSLMLQAEVEQLLSILPPTTQNIIVGVKRPSNFHFATGYLNLPRRDESYTVSQEIRAEMYAQGIFPCLYQRVKGVKPTQRMEVAKGEDAGYTAGRVLPRWAFDVWGENQIGEGDYKVTEEYTLPQRWEDLGSRVYEMVWSTYKIG